MIRKAGSGMKTREQGPMEALTWTMLWESSTTPIAGLSHPRPFGLRGITAICIHQGARARRYSLRHENGMEEP